MERRSIIVFVSIFIFLDHFNLKWFKCQDTFLIAPQWSDVEFGGVDKSCTQGILNDVVSGIDA